MLKNICESLIVCFCSGQIQRKRKRSSRRSDCSGESTERRVRIIHCISHEFSSLVNVNMFLFHANLKVNRIYVLPVYSLLVTNSTDV